MYYMTSSRVRKIELREHLDPDFGSNVQPDQVDAYVISVTPKDSQDAS